MQLLGAISTLMGERRGRVGGVCGGPPASASEQHKPTDVPLSFTSHPPLPLPRPLARRMRLRWVDLVVGNFGSSNALFKNDRGVHSATDFWDVSVSSGIADGPTPTRSVGFVDADGDGLLELFIGNSAANTGGWSQMWKFNQTQRRFQDVSSVSGVKASAGAVSLQSNCWADIDGDGDVDGYMSVGWGGHGILLRNNKGVFTDVSSSSGLPAGGDARGCGFGDYDQV